MAAIEISVSIEELRKKKIFVATPMYGGMCGGQYTKSTATLRLWLHSMVWTFAFSICSTSR